MNNSVKNIEIGDRTDTTESFVIDIEIKDQHRIELHSLVIKYVAFSFTSFLGDRPLSLQILTL